MTTHVLLDQVDRADGPHDHAVEAGAEARQQAGGVLEGDLDLAGIPEGVPQQGEGAVGDQGERDDEEGDQVDDDAAGDHLATVPTVVDPGALAAAFDPAEDEVVEDIGELPFGAQRPGRCCAAR